MPGVDRNIPRPIAGVMGDRPDQIDWVLVAELVNSLPWLSWVFAARLHAPLPDRRQRSARDLVLSSPTTYFVGALEEGAAVATDAGREG